MSRHHFVPVFILRNYVSEEAWRLVSASQVIKRKVAKNDRAVIQKGSYRSSPVCVLDKRTGKIDRRVLKDVCSATNFYALPEYSDPVIRGIVRNILRSVVDSEEFHALSDEELAELGQQPLDRDEIERMDISPVDGQFSRLIGPLRDGKMLSLEEIDIVLKSIALARYRSPTWREVYYPETFTRVQKRIQNLRSQGRAQGLAGPSKDEEDKFDQEIEKSLYQLALVQACLRDQEALARAEAKIVVLHSTGSGRFVATDNPARPYFDSDIRNLHTQGLPGIGNPGTQAAYPLSPDTCLLISTSSSLPPISHEEARGDKIRSINTVLALSARHEIVLPGPKPYWFLPWLDVTEIPAMKRP